MSPRYSYKRVGHAEVGSVLRVINRRQKLAMQVGSVLQVIWGQAEVGHVLFIILVQAGLNIVFTVPLQMYFHLFQFQNTVFSIYETYIV